MSVRGEEEKGIEKNLWFFLSLRDRGVSFLKRKKLGKKCAGA